MDLWNAKTYSHFLELRTRPAQDLLSAIPNSFIPSTVYDLGCGPGNSTILLKNRWPNAKVIGVDSSNDMLEKAQKTYTEISFINQNIALFSPQEKLDCLFANASFQWLDAHEAFIPRLLSTLNSGGILAFQMPNNFHSPSHQVSIRVLNDNIIWQPILKKLRYGLLKEPLYNPLHYYDLLTNSGAQVLQCWETTYLQEMSTHQEIFDWMKGTGLRPILSTMDSENQTQFAERYIEAIIKEYPLRENHKVLLPFRRMFLVASK